MISPFRDAASLPKAAAAQQQQNTSSESHISQCAGNRSAVLELNRSVQQAPHPRKTRQVDIVASEVDFVNSVSEPGRHGSPGYSPSC